MLEKDKNKENKKLIPLRRFTEEGLYSTAYLSLLVQRKKLKAKKVGRNYFTTREWFNEYLELHAREGKRRVAEDKRVESISTQKDVLDKKFIQPSQSIDIGSLGSQSIDIDSLTAAITKRILSAQKRTDRARVPEKIKAKEEPTKIVPKKKEITQTEKVKDKIARQEEADILTLALGRIDPEDKLTKDWSWQVKQAKKKTFEQTRDLVKNRIRSEHFQRNLAIRKKIHQRAKRIFQSVNSLAKITAVSIIWLAKAWSKILSKSVLKLAKALKELSPIKLLARGGIGLGFFIFKKLKFSLLGLDASLRNLIHRQNPLLASLKLWRSGREILPRRLVKLVRLSTRQTKLAMVCLLVILAAISFVYFTPQAAAQFTHGLDKIIVQSINKTGQAITKTGQAIVANPIVKKISSRTADFMRAIKIDNPLPDLEFMPGQNLVVKSQGRLSQGMINLTDKIIAGSIKFEENIKKRNKVLTHKLSRLKNEALFITSFWQDVYGNNIVKGFINTRLAIKLLPQKLVGVGKDSLIMIKNFSKDVILEPKRLDYRGLDKIAFRDDRLLGQVAGVSEVAKPSNPTIAKLITLANVTATRSRQALEATKYNFYNILQNLAKGQRDLSLALSDKTAQLALDSAGRVKGVSETSATKLTSLGNIITKTNQQVRNYTKTGKQGLGKELARSIKSLTGLYTKTLDFLIPDSLKQHYVQLYKLEAEEGLEERKEVKIAREEKEQIIQTIFISPTLTKTIPEIIGPTKLIGRLTVQGGTELAGDLAVSGPVRFDKRLTVLGGADLIGGIYNSQGNVIVDDNLEVKFVLITKQLRVTDWAEFQGTINADYLKANEILVREKLNVVGDGVIQGSLSIGRNLDVAGTFSSGHAQFASLGVSSFLSGNSVSAGQGGFSTSGDAYFQGDNVYIASAVDLNNILDIDSNSTLALTVGDGLTDNFIVDTSNDVITISGSTVMTGSLDLTGAITVTGASTLTGTTTIVGDIYLTGALRGQTSSTTALTIGDGTDDNLIINTLNDIITLGYASTTDSIILNAKTLTLNSASTTTGLVINYDGTGNILQIIDNTVNRFTIADFGSISQTASTTGYAYSLNQAGVNGGLLEITDQGTSRFTIADYGVTTLTTASSTGTALTITQNSSGDILNLYDSVGEVLTVLDGGNLGIGTTSPWGQLSVEGQGSKPEFVVTGTDMTPDFIVDVSGNVGIGTTSPFTKFSVVGNTYLDGNATTTGLFHIAGVGTSTIENNFWIKGTLRIGNSSAYLTTNGLNFTAASTIGTAAGLLTLSGAAGITNTSTGGTYTINATGQTIDIDSTTYTLDTTGAVTLNTNTTFTASSTGAMVLKGDTFTASSTGVMAFWTNNQERLTINTSGNVGIGTTSPVYLLDVGGDFRVGIEGKANTFYVDTANGRVGIGTSSPENLLQIVDAGSSAAPLYASGGYNTVAHFIGSDGGAASIIIDNSSGGDPRINFKDNATTKWSIGFDNDDSDKFKISENVNLQTNTRVTIEQGGNFGIGTTTPDSKLTVLGTATQLTLKYNENNYQDFAIQADGSLQISQDGGSVTLALTNGRVGIGTTSPWGLLSVNAPGGTDPFVIGSSTATQFIVKESGNVGIGTDSPGYKLTVAGNAQIQSTLDMFNNAIATVFQISNSSGNALRITQTGTADVQILLDSDTNLDVGTGQFYVQGTSGNVGIGTTTPNSLLSLYQASADTALTFGDTDTTRWIMGSDYDDSRKFKIEAASSLGGATPAFVLTSAGNLGIGTSSPFTKLSVAGNIYADGTITVSTLTATSSISAPYFTATGSSATSTFAGGLTVNSTSLVVDHQTGNVGIGTDSPFASLEIEGQGTTTPTNAFNVADGSIFLHNIGTDTQTDGTVGIFGWNAPGPGLGSGIGFSREDSSNWGTQIRFYTHPTSVSNISDITERMRIISSGNVGIGTTTPKGILHIASTNPYLYITDTDADTDEKHWWINSSSGDFSIGTTTDDLASTKTYLTIKKDTGYVGIGTDSPDGKLQVYSGDVYIGDSGTTDNSILYVYGPNDGSARAIIQLESQAGQKLTLGSVMDANRALIDSTYGLEIDFASDGGSIYDLLFKNAGSELMRIKGTGNVGIGTTSPYAKLSVVGDLVIEYLHATSTIATSTIAGGLNVGSGALVYDFSSGVTSIDALEVGPMSFETDAGIVSWLDMTVSTTTSGIVMSYTAQLDGNPMLTVYGTTDGLGGVNNRRIGISTTTPFAVLSVNAPGGTDPFVIGSSTATQFIVKESGYVGIGTDSPDFRLHVKLGAGEGSELIKAEQGTNWLAISNAGIKSTTNLYLDSASGSGDIMFRPGGVSQKMILTDAGKLGIGTTTPAYLLDVDGDFRVGVEGKANTLYVDTTAGLTTMTNASSTLFTNSGDTWLTDLATAAGTFLAADPSGKVIATTTPSGGSPFSTITELNALLLSESVASTTWVGASSIVTVGTLTGGATSAGFTVDLDSSTIICTNCIDISANTNLAGTTNEISLDGDTLSLPDVVYLGSSGKLGRDANNLIDFTTDNQIMFRTNATDDRLVINSSGYVGIGTSSPASKFTVSGNPGDFLLYDSGAATDDTTAGTFFRTDSGKLTIQGMNSVGSGGTISFTIDHATQRVGIGTTSPMSRLSVTASSGAQLTLAYDNDNYVNFTVDSSGSLEIASTNATATTTIGVGDEAMRIDSSGNVGIGTTSPLTKLDVYGNMILSGAGHYISFGDTVGSTGYGLRDSSGNIQVKNSGGSWADIASALWTASGSDIYYTTGNVGIGTTSPWAVLSVNAPGGTNPFVIGSSTATQFIVKESGRVGIGTASPSARLSLGTALANTKLAIYDGGSTEMYGFGVQNNQFRFHVNAAADRFSFLDDEVGTNELVTILGTGNVGIGTTSPFALLSVNAPGGTNPFVIGSSTATQFIVTESGNVGIGTTTPKGSLQVAGSIMAVKGGSTPTAGAGPVLQSSGTVAYVFGYKYGAGGGSLPLALNSPGGNVGIGTDNPGSYKLNVVGNTIITGSLNLTTSLTMATNQVLKWSDDNVSLTRDGSNYMRIRAYAGFKFNTYFSGGFADRMIMLDSGYLGIGASATNPSNLIELDSDTFGTTGGWQDSSDRNRKENFLTLDNVLLPPVKLGTWSGNGSTIDAIEYDSGDDVNLDNDELLSRLAMMPIMRWNFIDDDDTNKMSSSTVKHISPTAQDFYKLFGLTSADTRVKSTDLAGVALAGIKALNEKVSPLTNNIIIDGDNIGLGTATPNYKLDIVGQANSTGGWLTSGADYAEYYYTINTDLSSGEVVCVDITRENAVKRCDRAADGNVMGIVSTNPAIVGNNQTNYKNNSNYIIVGMLGQVPAKATTANGPIRPGDSLTSASIPGYLMRASAGDPTVGVALEGLSEGTGRGIVNVLISRRNKSITVEEVEEKVTERIANMEIEDEVNILIARAIDTLDLDDEIAEVVDPKLLLLETKLTVQTDDLGEKIVNVESDISSVISVLANYELRITNYELRIRQLADQITNYQLLITSIAVDENGNLKLGQNNPPDPLYQGGDNQGGEPVVEIVTATTTNQTAFVINQVGEGDVADFRVQDVSIMNIDSEGKVTVVGELMVDGRIMVCAGGSCGQALDQAVDETMGDIGVEGKVVAGAFEGYCEDGFVWVPGSAKYGTMPGFCVQARKAAPSLNPSPAPCVAGGGSCVEEPWTNLSQGEASLACQSLDIGYHLISENEWLTIAENVIKTPANDIDSAIEGLQLAVGENATSSSYALTNDNVIYDLAGGMGEWTSSLVQAEDMPVLTEDDWQEYYEVSSYKSLTYAIPPYYLDSSNGIGKIKTGFSTSGLRGFVRGGSGIYSLDLSFAPTAATSTIGFRCAR